MSRPITCLHISRCLKSLPTGSSRTPVRVSSASRRYLHSSFRSRPCHQPVSAPTKTTSQRILARSTHTNASDQTSHDIQRHDAQSIGVENRENETHFAEHLNQIFSPLKFPPPLAQRILTHGSHKAAAHGHNARMSFIGRRVLESYLLLFIHSCPSDTYQDHDLILSRALNTYVVGEHVAPKWELHRVLRWSPKIPMNRLASVTRRIGMQKKQQAYLEDTEGQDAGDEWIDVQQFGSVVKQSVGLHKVQGEAVQAVMGGIFHQFGGSIAHRVFHTRLLPHLLLPRRADGVPDAFHEDALRMCQKMGGIDGPLILERGKDDVNGIQRSDAPTVNSAAMLESGIEVR